MSDSELWDFFYDLRLYFCWKGCAYYDDCCNPIKDTGHLDCRDGIKAYLQEAVTDEQWSFDCQHFLEI